MRRVEEVLKGRETSDGAGVRLRRIFGYHQVPRFDPFLLLDEFGADDPSEYVAGFPWHPHRGIETITYVLTGDVEHGDSLGNSGPIVMNTREEVDQALEEYRAGTFLEGDG